MSEWIIGLFGKDKWEECEIYATNFVKCILQKFPTNNGGIDYLEPVFQNCKKHLIKEILDFKPKYVFTFGEPCYQLFNIIIN
jgi:uracil-DNA glycosylase